MPVTRMTKETLKQELDAADDAARPVLVDVRLRYPFEHSTVKLPGAIRLAPHEPGSASLPRDRELVLYDSDPNEVTSVQMAADLLARGYRVRVLKGGLPDWLSANLPTETKDAVRPAPPPAAAAKEPAVAKG
ncbi:MAG: rhodanese-like domain-containing protein [Acidobacteriota bacterium]